jgi:hypothetical protein
VQLIIIFKLFTILFYLSWFFNCRFIHSW